MATGDFVVFDKAKEWIGDGTLDLDTVTWKCAVCDNTAVPAASSGTYASPKLGDFTEVGTAGTYVAGGTALTVTWAESGGTVTFDSSTNPTWAQHASNDTDAYWGIVYAVGTLGGVVNPALGYVELGGPVNMATGALTITWNASGLFTLA